MREFTVFLTMLIALFTMSCTDKKASLPSDPTGGFKNYRILDLTDYSYVDRELAPLDLLTNPVYKETKMVFRLIPAGVFMMGAAEEDAYSETVTPKHSVCLTRPKYLSVFITTQAQWYYITGLPGNDGTKNISDHVAAYYTLRPQTDNFFDTINSYSGASWSVRLPTDAEWEYACRAGTTSVYYYGGTFNPDKLFCTESVPDTDILPDVGCYPPNPWGLYDMYGISWEFTQDTWRQDWYTICYQQGTVYNPLDTLHDPEYYPQALCIRGGPVVKTVPGSKVTSYLRGCILDPDVEHMAFRVVLEP